MNSRKHVVFVLLILLFLASALLTGCGGTDMSAEKALDKFAKIIESGKLDDLSLTIYYVSPTLLTNMPLPADALKGGKNKIVIDGSRLEEHIDLLSQINGDILVPIESGYPLDARLYFIFNNKNRKIFDVVIKGTSDGSMYVNGLEIEQNDIFYYLILPFLPEDVPEAEGWIDFINARKQEIAENGG